MGFADVGSLLGETGCFILRVDDMRLTLAEFIKILLKHFSLLFSRKLFQFQKKLAQQHHLHPRLLQQSKFNDNISYLNLNFILNTKKKTKSNHFKNCYTKKKRI